MVITTNFCERDKSDPDDRRFSNPVQDPPVYLSPHDPPTTSSSSSEASTSNSIPGTPSATPNSNEELCRENGSMMAPLEFNQIDTTTENGTLKKAKLDQISPQHQNLDNPAEVLRSLCNYLRTHEDVLLEYSAMTKDATASFGVLMRMPQLVDTLKPVPVTLLPTLIPERSVRDVVQIQRDINLLMHRVSHDREFLRSVLQGAASVDGFIRNLLNIYSHVDIDNQLELGLFRSDYILHKNNICNGDDKKDFDASYKQVEVNTICVGLSAIGSKVHKVHDRVLKYMDIKNEMDGRLFGDTLSLYGKGLRRAHQLYCDAYPSSHEKCLLIVIHKGFEFNIMDQRFVEFESGLRAIRRTFEQIRATVKVSDSGALFVEGFEISVVYYRTAYMPSHYDSQDDWDLRLLIEKSAAIKCPSIGYQLAGSKKVQQVLNDRKVLRRFVDDEATCDRLLAVTVGQWDLSDPEASPKIDDALLHPENYVLKPNREGGGNNFYFQDLVDKIHKVRGSPDAQDYILMEKIHSPFQENFLIRPQVAPEFANTINEIGVFGAIIAKGEKIYHNENAEEVLVRSKSNTVNEGGLAVGSACLSSTWLV